MPTTPNRVALDRVDWLSVAPVLRLAGAFRHALQPGKLVVALLAVLALHGCGSLLDLMWGDKVSLGRDTSVGVYEAIVMQEARAFELLLDSALSLEFGRDGSSGIVGGLGRMFIEVPAWAFLKYPWFTGLFGLCVLVVLALAGGMICRMAASQVCLGRNMALPRAARFVGRRWAWYLITPLLPTLLILGVGVGLIAAGFVFFNAPVLDVIGSLLYGLLLLGGFIIALATVLLVFALFLMNPAMSVEGTDSFDVISRAFNYVMFRPWHYATYLIASIVYAALVAVLVMVLSGLTVEATYNFVDTGSFSEPIATSDVDRHDMIFRLAGAPTEASDALPVTISASGWIVARWLDLVLALVIAVVFSVVCCLQTQAYVLMRKSADGTPLDDCALDDMPDPWSSPADMVDPQAQAIAKEGPSAATRPINDEPPPANEG